MVIWKKTLDAKPKSIITIRFSFFAGKVLVLIESVLLLAAIFVALARTGRNMRINSSNRMGQIASAYRAGLHLAICICTLPALGFAQWIAVEASGTEAGLRGVHNAGRGIIWASGSGGTVLRSEDDGFVWQKCSIPESARSLDFRGVWGWDANHAIAMSSGTGDVSRLYETRDGGATWRLLLQNADPAGFWDGLVFSGNDGLLVGDQVNGRLTVFRTKDLGQHWTRDSSPGLAAGKGEGIFAASNSSVTTRQGGTTFAFVTGGTSEPRFFGSGIDTVWNGPD